MWPIRINGFLPFSYPQLRMRCIAVASSEVFVRSRGLEPTALLTRSAFSFLFHFKISFRLVVFNHFPTSRLYMKNRPKTGKKECVHDVMGSGEVRRNEIYNYIIISYLLLFLYFPITSLTSLYFPSVRRRFPWEVIMRLGSVSGIISARKNGWFSHLRRRYSS